jgi:hypothetical protein
VFIVSVIPEEFSNMSNVKFNALASLALLAGAPVVAQAAMVEMAETELAGVNGQGIIGDTFGAVFGALTDPFFNSGSTTSYPIVSFVDNNFNGVPDAGDDITYGVKTSSDGNYLPNTIGGLFADAGADFGAGVADIALQGPFRALGLIGQAKGTALDFLFFPISAPLDVAGNVFGALNDGVVGTASRILTAPLNAVFGPVNRYVDGVTGRFEATVDGAAYAVTEVKGALIAGAFASASQGAANNGLAFTSRVFGRISQAQAGLTANRLTDLSSKYGY